jgi:hypothetical protein
VNPATRETDAATVDETASERKNAAIVDALVTIEELADIVRAKMPALERVETALPV